MSFFKLFGKKKEEGATDANDDTTAAIPSTKSQPPQKIVGGISLGAPALSPTLSEASALNAKSASSSTAATATPAAASAPASNLPNVSSVCPIEKLQYERCFQHWYNDQYLNGKSRDLSGCEQLFSTYRTCVLTWYEKNEPDFLLSAAAASDDLLKAEGHTPFATKYPNLEAKKKSS